MKSVILIRHVKSDWSNLLTDFDRPIREDKKEDAKSIAEMILKDNAVPQYMIASPAKRTRQTTKLFCKVWGIDKKQVEENPALYECTAQEIINAIQSADENYKRIAIVCHNPAITDFANRYSNANIDNVPTSGALLIEFDATYWKEINCPGKLLWFLYPRLIGNNNPSNSL
jgi:phosphohistidine phosphatase